MVKNFRVVVIMEHVRGPKFATVMKMKFWKEKIQFALVAALSQKIFPEGSFTQVKGSDYLIVISGSNCYQWENDNAYHTFFFCFNSLQLGAHKLIARLSLKAIIAGYFKLVMRFSGDNQSFHR